jgi:NAD(P)-dependent dehydrogenase (short-subunit alcohol dehydrogenase family)
MATYDGVEAVQDAGRLLAAAALNAGIGGAFVDTAPEDELRMIAINVTSQAHLAKRIVRGVIAAGRGRILFTSSLSTTTTPMRPYTARPAPSSTPSPRACARNCSAPASTVTTLLSGATTASSISVPGWATPSWGQQLEE